MSNLQEQQLYDNWFCNNTNSTKPHTNLNNHQDQSHLEAHRPVATENRLCNVEFLSFPLAA